MPKKIWTEGNIKIGFLRFYTEHNRLPRSHEIDSLDYLPSSRLIQKKFDGLEKLRAKLGFTDTHFGKGDFRSVIAHKVNITGYNYERELEQLLYTQFGEVFVHSEKMLETSKVRVDFYVYSPDGNFAVDIFHSGTMRTLQSNVNIKVNKYTKYKTKIYLVSANNKIDQSTLDVYVRAKTNTLPAHIHLITYLNFVKLINNLKAYTNPINT